jgi:hypothetical protein
MKRIVILALAACASTAAFAQTSYQPSQGNPYAANTPSASDYPTGSIGTPLPKYQQQTNQQPHGLPSNQALGSLGRPGHDGSYGLPTNKELGSLSQPGPDGKYGLP